LTLLAIPFGLLIGLIVGSIGGGGATLALPVLVYVLGEGVNQASTAALIVVALAAALGGSVLAYEGHVCWRVALSFSAAGALGAVGGTAAGAAVDARTLILCFVPVMVGAAAATWRRAGMAVDGDDEGDCPHVRLRTLVLAGAGIGVMTGFFGVGGGFLIVPALTVGLGMSMRRAVASSLVIITLTALVALASHLASGVDIDVGLTALLAGSTGVGSLLGSTFGRRIPQQALGRAFGIVLCALAVFLLSDALFLGGPPTS
jgi:uncharacterized membrane protein YfcA